VHAVFTPPGMLAPPLLMARVHACSLRLPAIAPALMFHSCWFSAPSVHPTIIHTPPEWGLKSCKVQNIGGKQEAAEGRRAGKPSMEAATLTGAGRRIKGEGWEDLLGIRRRIAGDGREGTARSHKNALLGLVFSSSARLAVGRLVHEGSRERRRQC